MNKREREEYGAAITRLAALGISFRTAEELHRLSRRYNRLAEAECSIDDARQNYTLDRDGIERNYYDRAQARIEKRARALMPAGVELYVQGDCRGLSFYVCGPEVPRPLDSNYPQGVGL